MNNNADEGHEAPEIQLSLELDAKLLRLLNTDNAVTTRVRLAVEQYVTGFIETMGIPGLPRLEITELPEAPRPTAHNVEVRTGYQFLRFSVHGHECACSDHLLRSVYCSMESSLLLVEATPAYILSWLQKLLSDTENSERVGRGSEFLGLACVEILKIRPSVLLALPQATAYRALLASIEQDRDTTEGHNPPRPDWLLLVLQTVLNTYLTLAHPDIIAALLPSEAPPEEASEVLIANLLPPNIEIQMPLEYLKELTTGNAAQNMFTTLRTELFNEYGVRYPDFHFVINELLPPTSFTFKLNAVTTLPFVGLTAHQGLLPAPGPGSDDDVIRIINPLSGEIESLVEFKPEDSAFASARKQLDYFMLCFKATLKKQKALFVHRNFVADQCQRLKNYYPVLINTVKAKISDEQLTRILRGLVMENVSIRDMHFLLERLLDFVYTSADPEHNSILVYWMTAPRSEQEWANTPENAISFLKNCLKRTDLVSV